MIVLYFCSKKHIIFVNLRIKSGIESHYNEKPVFLYPLKNNHCNQNIVDIFGALHTLGARDVNNIRVTKIFDLFENESWKCRHSSNSDEHRNPANGWHQNI